MRANQLPASAFRGQARASPDAALGHIEPIGSARNGQARPSSDSAESLVFFGTLQIVNDRSNLLNLEVGKLSLGMEIFVATLAVPSQHGKLMLC
jgi:hypothetical protein